MTHPPRKALITGITGQDGSYLAELLLSKGYEVHGCSRKHADRWQIELQVDNQLRSDRLFIHHIDLHDGANLDFLLRTVRPDEVYHLGAQTNVHASFNQPEYTADITALGTLRILESLRKNEIPARFLQASTSEMFGRPPVSPQDESTPFHPRSPYGYSKLFAHWATVNYRESYSLHASSAILFNHESPRRGSEFVTRKITSAVARIVAGKQPYLSLGNIDASRDWGFAGDYVVAMWLMLQQPKASDYVIATGQTHTVRDFVREAFGCVGLDWQKFLRTDAAMYRPAESEKLVGDPSRARSVLGWKPHVDFATLVRMMVEADLAREGLSNPTTQKKAA